MPLLIQVREVSTRLEENICLMKSEMEFKEQSQQVYGSTQVHLKAEVPVCPTACPPVCVCMCVCLSVCPPVCLSTRLSDALF